MPVSFYFQNSKAWYPNLSDPLFVKAYISSRKEMEFQVPPHQQVLSFFRFMRTLIHTGRPRDRLRGYYFLPTDNVQQNLSHHNHLLITSAAFEDKSPFITGNPDSSEAAVAERHNSSKCSARSLGATATPTGFSQYPQKRGSR
ncbi:hypothetical protein ACH5RR_026906 [Cinchona calisaya]|uniref:Uncharacterized protein n=1 Tax=Cinchona calisaya TaxID=153742 RepID=A0ABD2Z534_9GENT